MTLCQKCIHRVVCVTRRSNTPIEEKNMKFCTQYKPKSRFVEFPCEESELLQEAVNVMNGIDEYHRCWICDAYKSESCDRDKYLHCDEFTWRGIKPTEKGE